MNWIDTHSHLYVKEFDVDRAEVMLRASQNGVNTILLPNIETASLDRLLDLHRSYPEQTKPMLGLHPSSVGADWKEQLENLLQRKSEAEWVAVGEIGMDLYWDKTFIEEQKQAFRAQIQWAKGWKLPIVIHARDAFTEIYEILDELCDDELTGVFHCFTGTIDDVNKIKTYPNFYFGLGGVVTYKKAALEEVILEIPKDRIILETDAPYLPPVPYRGKRNESSYMIYSAEKVADVLRMKLHDLADLTTENAKRLFHLEDYNQPRIPFNQQQEKR
jgi:TatD DNase family protein